MTVEGLIGAILVAEGWPKFTNDPADRGGPTKGGITLRTLAQHRGEDVTAADVEALEEPEVRAIYRFLYVGRPRFDEIHDELLQANVVDAGVLHGTGWAARRLQEVVGVKVDGIVGPVTLGKINDDRNPLGLDLLFTARRAQRVAKIVAADPSQIKYLEGWINRTVKFLRGEAVR